MSKWEKVLRKLLPYRNAKRFLFNDNFRLNKENRWREKKRKKKTPSLGGGTTMEPEISAPKDIFSFHKLSPENKQSRFRHNELHLGTMTRMCAINDTTAFFFGTQRWRYSLGTTTFLRVQCGMMASKGMRLQWKILFLVEIISLEKTKIRRQIG